MGAIAAGWVLVARAEKRLAGDRITQISNEFVAAQRELMQRFGVSQFSQVPAEPRLALLNAYKKAIAEVQVYHAGTIQPSKQIPYGR